MEVRFENLHIETEVYAETSRQLPSLWNAVRSSVEVSGYVDGQSTFRFSYLAAQQFRVL